MINVQSTLHTWTQHCVFPLPSSLCLDSTETHTYTQTGQLHKAQLLTVTAHCTVITLGLQAVVYNPRFHRFRRFDVLGTEFLGDRAPGGWSSCRIRLLEERVPGGSSSWGSSSWGIELLQDQAPGGSSSWEIELLGDEAPAGSGSWRSELLGDRAPGGPSSWGIELLVDRASGDRVSGDRAPGGPSSWGRRVGPHKL